MADIEKAIKGLQVHADGCGYRSHYCDAMGCPYRYGDESCDIEEMCRDALALLKEQEARILDWDELEDWANAVWFEDKDEHECYIALIANVGTYDAKFTNVEPGNIHSLDFMRDFYMKEWRCWSARPTIKQRQAVKWE